MPPQLDSVIPASTSPGVLDELGMRLYNRGLARRAQECFCKALEQTGDGEIGPRLRWLRFLRDRGRYHEAMACARTWLRCHPDDARLHYEAGRTCNRAGRVAAMRRYYLRFTQSPAGPEEGSLWRVGALLCLEDYSEAFRRAEEVMARDFSVDTMSRWRGLFPYSWWRPLPFRITSGYRRSLHAWARAHPGSPWPSFCRILLARSSGRAPEFADCALLRRAPPGRYGWMRYFSGVSALQAGRYRTARADLDAVIRSRPRFWPARWYRAEALLCRGRGAAALGDCAAFAADYDGDARCEMDSWYGEMLLWLGRYGEALERLEAGVRAGSWLGWCWKGAAHLLAGDRRAARADLDRAVAVGPRDAEALTWRGELHRVEGRWSQARADLAMASRLSAGDWTTCNQGLLAAAVGDRDALRRSFLALDREVAAYAAASLGLGFRDYQADRAVAILEQALRLASGIRRSDPYLRPIWMGGT